MQSRGIEPDLDCYRRTMDACSRHCASPPLKVEYALQLLRMQSSGGGGGRGDATRGSCTSTTDPQLLAMAIEVRAAADNHHHDHHLNQQQQQHLQMTMPKKEEEEEGGGGVGERGGCWRGVARTALGALEKYAEAANERCFTAAVAACAGAAAGTRPGCCPHEAQGLPVPLYVHQRFALLRDCSFPPSSSSSSSEEEEEEDSTVTSRR